MSANDSSPPASPTFNRRSSFTPNQSLSNLFTRPTSNANSGATSAFPSTIASAAANAQTRRRMSISTLGLSGTSPTQTSPFSAGAGNGSQAYYGGRRESGSSGSSGSPSLIDENVIEEGDASTSSSAPASTPTTPFARRISFGARALRDVRTGNGNGEGFSWSESLRSRAERTSSISAIQTPGNSPTSAPQHAAHHHRAQTVASAEMAAPVREIPKSPKVPDPFQERILKGDFYMD
ncbi:MAG: hypothetical protein M1817_001562 [Caeruleum heppii]|nr:MAG: hypothetical protein M1817_001562 [Caeruleum heppii]